MAPAIRQAFLTFSRRVKRLTTIMQSSGPGSSRRCENGKVGLNGISYYAINQWHVAALQPPHLAAMVPWEGAADLLSRLLSPWRDPFE